MRWPNKSRTDSGTHEKRKESKNQTISIDRLLCKFIACFSCFPSAKCNAEKQIYHDYYFNAKKQNATDSIGWAH